MTEPFSPEVEARALAERVAKVCGEAVDTDGRRLVPILYPYMLQVTRGEALVVERNADNLQIDKAFARGSRMEVLATEILTSREERSNGG
jgi:hypothetical protein